MKILHIVAGVWKDSGGLATLVLGFSREQAKAGHQVLLVFLEGDRHGGLTQAEASGVRVWSFKRSFPHFLFFSWGMLFGLDREVKDAEVVHIHSNWTFPVWWGGWLALRYKKTLVMSPQGCFDPVRLKHSGWKKKLVGWIDRWLLRRASVVHATCEGEKAWVQAFLGGGGRRSDIGGRSSENNQYPTRNDQYPIKKMPRIVVIPNGIEEVSVSLKKSRKCQ